MADTRIDELRGILARATARDEDLRQALETFAADFLKEIGVDAPPVWAEIQADKGERPVDPRFVMQNAWLCGNLIVEVTPEVKLVIGLRMSIAKNGTHEAGIAREASQSAIIDAPDEKERGAARKKLFDRIFASLEADLRHSIMFAEA